MNKLASCHPDLQLLCNEVIKGFDFSVICGHRDKAAQEKAVAEGKSQTPWPTSKHNTYPSKAVDLIPYPIDWLDTKAMTLLAGHMLQAAKARGIGLRWGGNWKGDNNPKDNKFNDLVHFELTF